MAIVPDVGENGGPWVMLHSMSCKLRELNMKTLDQEWNKLDDMVDEKSGLTYRQLGDLTSA